MEKIILRKKYSGLRQQIPLKDVAINSEFINQKLLNSQAYQKAKSIFTYIGVKNEVGTFQLIESAIQAEKIVAVPKTFPNGIMKFYTIKSIEGLSLSKFGLLEPNEMAHEIIPDQDTLMIVPGVVFDISGNRIGFGAGYYDRYLHNNLYGKAIALAFSNQVIEEVPSELWDIKMSAIITENAVYGKI